MKSFFWFVLACIAMVVGIGVVVWTMLSFPELKFKLAGIVIGAPFAGTAYVCLHMGGLAGKGAVRPLWLKLLPTFIVLGLILFFLGFGLWIVRDLL